ncbi:B12-binding domain-containing radical SAM protein [Verrucomicrobiota bacterium]
MANTDFFGYCEELRRRYRPDRRILLVQLPQMPLESFNADTARRRGYYAFPPTGLQCLYEALKNDAFEIRILDLNFELLKRVRTDPGFDAARWPSILDEHVGAFSPSLVGVSCMFDAGISTLLEALKRLKADGRRIVVAGGIIATYEGEALLRQALCHFTVRGEGENRFRSLLGVLFGDTAGAAPEPGIGYAVDGTPRFTDGEPERVALNTDMVDSYSLVPIEDYHRHGTMNPFVRMSGEPFAAVQMNRGCRASCRFCSVPDFMGKGVRGRHPDEVLREIEYLVKERGIRHFEWLDDDLLFRKNRFTAFLQRIIEADWGITWSASNGLIASSLDGPLLGLMRDSGCVGFRVGIETGNSEMLRRTRKPGSLDTFRKTAARVKDTPEIFVCGNYMLGFPGETFGMMMDTFRFSLELGLDWSGFTTCQPIRGAGMFEHFEGEFSRQMEQEGRGLANYIPVRESARGQLLGTQDATEGLEVFRIPPDVLPSPEQVKEIWFTFNLVGNYVHNANLMPGGRPEKFIAWVRTAQVPYPANPYMNLFLALAYTLAGDRAAAQDCLETARAVCTTEYWKHRFLLFNLRSILDDFPVTRAEALEGLRRLREKTAGSEV